MSLFDEKHIAMHLFISNDCASSFEDEQRYEQLQHYAHLLTQALMPASSVVAQENALQSTAPLAEQALYSQHFEHRVAELVREAANVGMSLSLQDAQRCVWQEIEEELLRYPTEGNDPELRHN